MIFIACWVFGQTEYVFDTVYVYEGDIKLIENEWEKEKRYYFLNSTSPDYFMVIFKVDSQESHTVLRDNKNGKIAEFVLDNFQINTPISLVIPDKILKGNRYINPLPYRNLTKNKQEPDSSGLTRYVYEVSRGTFKDEKYKTVARYCVFFVSFFLWN